LDVIQSIRDQMIQETILVDQFQEQEHILDLLGIFYITTQRICIEFDNHNQFEIRFK
jgi:hypothetical protein